MFIIKKILKTYKVGGVQAVAEKAKKKYYLYSENLARSWALFPIVREVIARELKTLQPTVLVLSLPRSGSSWVGETLGNAKNALYLREPITGTYQARGGTEAVFEFNPATPPKYYQIAANHAFSGIPVFPKTITKRPEQWSVFHRQYCRIIIKEVNPLALGWYLQNFEPSVIFLVRHPAAVALSWWRLGWRDQWDLDDKRDFFKNHGDFQGKVLQTALRYLKNVDNYKIVMYEELCNQPVSIFRNLFNFTGFEWDEQMEQFIVQHTVSGDRSIHWTTKRDSKKMIYAWKDEIADNELHSLRKAFSKYDLPWYKTDEYW